MLYYLWEFLLDLFYFFFLSLSYMGRPFNFVARPFILRPFIARPFMARPFINI